MSASIGSHFENINSQYIQKEESDLHAVCIKMCSFPNTFRQKSFVFLCSFPFKMVKLTISLYVFLAF